jgi:hypothetical protein
VRKKLPRTIDRSIARMIATKRIITGSLALAAGVGLAIVAASHGAPTPALGLALLIFFGGGGWTLRDGLRLRRELHLTRGGESARPDPDHG